ncbi:MAG: transglycosylase domain-containing protein, partial [Bacteroidales bacterium]|nr:transglycosylase domain-containing protein [Bacteroidales bacterium]
MKNSNIINKILIIFWTGVFVVIIGFVIYFSLSSRGFFGKMPTFEELENKDENLATKIWSEDNNLLGTYFRENRYAITFDQLSPTLIDALISTEDIRFYDHDGIDFKALPRVFSGLLGNSSKGGGSTITQQLAKMLFPRKSNMSKMELVHRKFQEWIIAVKIEKNFTKEEILAMYLNKFDFLNLAVGIESAARVYFNTTPDKLKIEQVAMLIGMAKNPSLFNPLRREEETLKRRNVVLSQMVKYDKLSKAEFDSLKLLPLEINYHPVDHNLGSATYFREFLRQWLTAKEPIKKNYTDERDYIEDSINWYSEPSYGWFSKNTKSNGDNYDIYKDGLQIYTTIDSRMQKYAEEAIIEHIGTFIQPAFFKDQLSNTKPPFGNDVTQAQIEKIISSSMRRSDRWIELKSTGMSEAKIEETFYEPIKMTVFSWDGDTTTFNKVAKKFQYPAKIVPYEKIKKTDHDIDVIMTPYDSILYYKHFLRTGFMSM